MRGATTTEDALRKNENVVPALQTRAHTRIARPDDIASAVVYLSSNALAGHITGEILTVSGGMEGRLLHKNWSLYDVEHVVFRPKLMTPERLQEGLEWSWRQSYTWRSIFTRVLGSRCVLSLSISLNIGYRSFANRLRERTWPIYREQEMNAEPRVRQEICAGGPQDLEVGAL